MRTSKPCRIRGDRWNGALSQEWQTDNPSAADFEQALLRLDAKEYTMMTVAGDDETHLTIGGGGGRYVVYATFDNENFWNLMRRDPIDGTVLLNAGGQEGDFPAARVVGLEQARAAGRVFLDYRQLDPSQEWEKG